MQIIIELEKDEKNLINQNDESKNVLRKSDLNELLLKLSKDGYKIDTLTESFIYDEKNKKFIDCGKHKFIEKPQKDYFQIVDLNLYVLTIFTKEKYVVFSNRHFVLICFCHMRKVCPLSCKDVLNNYDELITKENNLYLDKLYLNNFELKYGKDKKPIPHLFSMKNFK